MLIDVSEGIYFTSDGAGCGLPQEDMSEAKSVHATFNESVKQLAAASEDYKRDGVDFLLRLLQPNPNTRMTMDEALRHPFLTRTFFDVDHDAMPPEIMEDIMLETTLDRVLWAQCGEELQTAAEGGDDGEDDMVLMEVLEAHWRSGNTAWNQQ
jgi:hypothetical protein